LPRFLQTAVALVAKQKCANSIVRYKNVRPTVVVKIGRADGEAFSFRLKNFRFLRYIRKRSVAIVVVKRVAAPLKALGGQLVSIAPILQ